MKIAIPISISKTQFFINQVYISYISNAGYEPVLITPDNNRNDMAGICDGLLLPGGIDIEPTYYGEDNLSSKKADPVKDAFEREVLYTFMSRGKPIFGICRGFQLIVREFLLRYGNEKPKDLSHSINNIFYYSQHVYGHSLTSERDIERNVPSHSVIIDSGILYGDAIESDKIFVNSIHHQALKSTIGKLALADTLVLDDGNVELAVAAYTDFGMQDTKGKPVIIEAVDMVQHGCRLRGVQWHPEELNDVVLLRNFFES